MDAAHQRPALALHFAHPRQRAARPRPWGSRARAPHGASRRLLRDYGILAVFAALFIVLCFTAPKTTRLLVIGLTFALILSALAVRARREGRVMPPAVVVLRGNGVAVALRVVTAALAVAAVFFVIRTGHLGAQLTWGQQGGGSPPGATRQPPGGG